MNEAAPTNVAGQVNKAGQISRAAQELQQWPAGCVKNLVPDAIPAARALPERHPRIFLL
jgi:hypothetical protein